MAMERFEELEVWQTARKLANLIYKLPGGKEWTKDFGLRDQIRRAAISVMSNIAGGFEGRTQMMFIEYLGRARASAGEVRSQLYLARGREYLDESGFGAAIFLCRSYSRQIGGLVKYLESKPERSLGPHASPPPRR